ncbi:ADP compounds hydrolase NudE [Steroidobacter sp.]|uniref:ADP compounds hydrolase NudE n=1 Tax=Steroidobacter sp. TaxID=1978227 RepID=UPI001A3B745D|nr:ADP compounds hydrolase NudE [Steroidobacter sp.]MBL8271361.1 ADP compounds hydrolase NudE [Steroidobacter sp.]
MSMSSTQRLKVSSVASPLSAVPPAKAVPEILHRRMAAQSRMFQIEAVQLRFDGGAEREYERIAAPAAVGTVIVVAAPAPGELLLIREYAVGLERYEWSLPMGGVNSGETLLQAANRELREETGFSARSLTPLHTLSLAPGIFAYQAQVVLATDLVFDPAVGDEPETLDVVSCSFEQLQTLIFRGEFTEARSLASVFIAREWLARRDGDAALHSIRSR